MKFERMTAPLLICLLKLIVELYIQIVSLLTTVLFTNITDVVVCFISLTVISTVDVLYYHQTSSVLKEKMISQSFELPMTRKSVVDKPIWKSELPMIDKCLYIFADLI